MKCEEHENISKTIEFLVYFSKYMRVANTVRSRLRIRGRKKDCPRISN